MRLVTWNVNSIRARLERVLALLEQHQPDVACLQETKVGDDAFPHEALAAAGYRAVACCEGRWNGVALLVPDDVEIADVRTRLPGSPSAEQARWVEAVVRGVRVASVYVPNGRDPAHPLFPEKLAFLEAMRDRAAEAVAAGPTIVAGDVNVARTDDDVWDTSRFVGATHVTDDERSRLEGVLAAGLVDAWEVAGGEGRGFTWWDYRAGAFPRGMGMRIDLAMVSRDLTVREAAVDTAYRRKGPTGVKPSDHAPLLVTVDR